MRLYHTHVLRACRRARQFITAHTPAVISAIIAPALAELDDVIARLEQIGFDQEAGRRTTRAETRHQRSLRKTLRQLHMYAISKIARHLFGRTGVDRALRRPDAKIPNEALISAARAMAESAEKESERFIRAGLPADFVEQLRAATDALDSAMVARVDNARRMVQATAAARIQVTRAVSVLGALDGAIVTALSDNAELLAAWRNARRVTTVPGSGSSSLDGEGDAGLKVA